MAQSHSLLQRSGSFWRVRVCLGLLQPIPLPLNAASEVIVRSIGLLFGLACLAISPALLSGCAITQSTAVPAIPASAVTPKQLLDRLHHSVQLQDWHTAGESLLILMERFPTNLNELPDDDLMRCVGALRNNAESAVLRRQILDALFKSGWKTSYGVEPSALWVDLALLHLAEHDLVRASEIGARVTNPFQRIKMHADRRFEPIVEPDGVADDIWRHAQFEVTEIKATVDRNPRLLRAVVQLAHALHEQQRYTEAIEVTDSAIRAVTEAASTHAVIPFDDVSQLTWLLYEKATALWDAGYFDEGAAVQESARRFPEDGGTNVSQTLNLALTYLSLGKPEQANAVAHDMDNNQQFISPFGKVVLRGVHLRSALQTGDNRAIDFALGYLRIHGSDDPMAAIDGFILAGAITEADSLLQNTLADPDKRAELLGRLQHFAATAETALEQANQARLQTWIARSEVQTEIARWGRIDRYPVPNID